MDRKELRDPSSEEDPILAILGNVPIYAHLLHEQSLGMNLSLNIITNGGSRRERWFLI